MNQSEYKSKIRRLIQELILDSEDHNGLYKQIIRDTKEVIVDVALDLTKGVNKYGVTKYRRNLASELIGAERSVIRRHMSNEKKQHIKELRYD